MKIDSSAIGMESARSYKASNTTVRRFAIRDYQQSLGQGGNALNAAIGGNAGDAGNTKDTDGTKENGQTVLADWQARFQAAPSAVSVRNAPNQTFAEFRQQTLRYIFDLLFASRRNRLSRWIQEDGLESGSGVQSTAQSTASGVGGEGMNGGVFVKGAFQLQPLTLAVNMKVLSLGQDTYFEEAEDTSFSTTGTVKTSDGREINFNVNIGMSRRFQEHYREDLELASFAFCDPLVINLDTDVAQLEDQTFYFDIDGDGEQDEIAQLSAKSGYLALDKNGDGIINDGKELFGTASGNGFADLAEYDQDGNGWIDENDDIWNKLKIWTKDENGQDVLYTLAEKGVGAICLQNASTDFTQKDLSGQTLGAVRSTGVFLYENGNVGTVQHLDVAKYEKQA